MGYECEEMDWIASGTQSRDSSQRGEVGQRVEDSVLLKEGSKLEQQQQSRDFRDIIFIGKPY